jgi:prevent-host-death family protein
VPEVTATDAARNFADLLDAVEHKGQRYVVVRRGRAVAEIHPLSGGRGADVKAMLRRHRPDAKWSKKLASVRGLLEVEDRS